MTAIVQGAAFMLVAALAGALATLGKGMMFVTDWQLALLTLVVLPLTALVISQLGLPHLSSEVGKNPRRLQK